MPAPSGIKWGSEVTDDNGMKGKIGVHISVSNVNGGTSRATVQIWYWSRTSVEDYGNQFQYSTDGGKTYKNLGAIAIVTSSNTHWSTSNQVHITTFTIDKTRSQTNTNYSVIAKFSGVDWGGGAGSVTATYTIPALATYTISYNANGGTNAPTSQVKKHGSNVTLTTAVPTREGYNFLGWSKTSNGSVEYSAGATYGENQSRTLYAVWSEKQYTVTYDANGGDTSTVPTSSTKYYFTDLTLPYTVPTKEKYDFLGWHTSPNATEPLYVGGDKYTNNSNVTLYAVWKLSYVRPRIFRMSVSRCNADGTENEAGTFAYIDCQWETDKEGAVYAIYYKLVTETEEAYKLADRQTMSGTDGTLSTVIMSEGTPVVFDTEYAYHIKINIADNEGFTPTTRVLNSLFIPIDFTEDMKTVTFGEPAQDDEESLLKFAFDRVDLAPKSILLYKGEAFFGQNLLWSGNSLMNETHSITLKKPISETKNGILLVFSRNGDYNAISYFVPKQTVVSFGKTGWCFPLCTQLFDYIGAKTLYIGDEIIEGHADNDATGKNATSGITYHNEAFFLRYVYEV